MKIGKIGKLSSRRIKKKIQKPEEPATDSK